MIIFPEIVNIDPFMKYFAHPTAVIDEGAVIGAGSKIWHFSHIMPGSSIGEDCSIGQNVMVGEKVVLGSGVKIQNNVSLFTGVTCEDDVFIGPSAVFTNVINPRSAISRKDQFRPTLIRKGATIGANATIVCGNEIGQYAFIGAGAVVTHPVPAYALMLGNPARQSGWMSEYGHTLHPDATGRATCPGSGQVYQEKDNQLTRVEG
jgi:UDP-2-acetamido-3-amino-2,3-dideoxy-glucuronate N-acetyltransferase